MVIIALLIIVGLILVLAEILLIPGVFLTGILGVGCMAYSCYLSFTLFGMLGGILTLVINSGLLIGCIIYALRSNTWKKVSLHTEIDSRTDQKPEEKGIAAGQDGVTVTRLNPMGKVRIGNTILEASTLDGFIDENSQVTVSEIIDNKIYVKLK